jgi:hypothetical protein
MKVRDKYFAIDDDKKGDCIYCPFSRGFFNVAFSESKYNQQYQDLVDNKSYSGCAARAFLLNKYYGTNFNISDKGQTFQYNVGCHGDPVFDLRTVKFIPTRNTKI